MSNITLWNWEKKKRTMRRYIKAGDIFCFQYNENTYCFGRIIIKRGNSGIISEIFDYISENPVIPKEVIEKGSRMFHPLNLNHYTLFDRKMFGDWRIIGYCDNFSPSQVENVFFTCGVCPYIKIDLFGNKEIITKEEAMKLHVLALYGNDDHHIKELVKSVKNLEYSEVEPKLPPKQQIGPFIISDASILLNAGTYKQHIFDEESERGFCGNGHDWASLAREFIKEQLPHLQKDIQFDPEADMFCAYSENKKSILEFAQSFYNMCEDEKQMREILSRSELD